MERVLLKIRQDLDRWNERVKGYVRVEAADKVCLVLWVGVVHCVYLVKSKCYGGRDCSRDGV